MKANTQIGPMSYADFLLYCEKEGIDAEFWINIRPILYEDK